MKSFLHFSATLLFYTFTAICSVSAQYSLKDAMKFSPDFHLPYFQTKNKSIMQGIAIEDEDIPLKVYTNVQCTEFVTPDTYAGMPKIVAKINIPYSPYTLFNIRIASGRLSTEELLLTDENGKILDVLVGKIMTDSGVIVKQFYIKKNCEIVVISLEPEDEETSIPIDKELISFNGKRIDRTYKVEKGKFVLKNEKPYDLYGYYYQLLADETYDLWNGRENSANEDMKNISDSKEYMNYALKHTPEIYLPYKRMKSIEQKGGYFTAKGKLDMPTKIYTDMQCRKHLEADDMVNIPEIYGKIKLKSSPHTLAIVSLSIESKSYEGETCYLLLTDSYGNITDSLIAKVYAYNGIISKQFYIKKDESIVIATLHPEKEESVPLTEKSDLMGFLTYDVYKARNGKFVKTGTLTCETKEYSNEQLSAMTYNLWDGNEKSVSSQGDISALRNDDGVMSLSDAMKYHEENYVMLPKLSDEEYIRNFMLPYDNLQPDWRLAYCYAKDDVSYMEVPIEGQYFTIKRNEITGNKYRRMTQANLIFRKDGYGAIKEYIRTIIADNTSSSNNISETGNSRYSGVVIYTDMDGTVTRAERYEEGHLMYKLDKNVTIRLRNVLGPISFIKGDYYDKENRKHWWSLMGKKPVSYSKKEKQ